MDFDLDYLLLTAGLTRPAESRRWAGVLAALEAHAEQRLSGATIRVLDDRSDFPAAIHGVAACLVAKFSDPAIVILRAGLRPGEGVWHAARLLVRLSGSPVVLTPGEVGVITSPEIPSKAWPEGSPENATDHAAIGLLASLGANRWQALKYARFHI